MTEMQLFILSDQALNNVVQQIKDNQWKLEVPQYISPKGGTLREIINYHAYYDAFVPDTYAGKTIAEVGNKYDRDLLGNNPKVHFEAIVEKSIAAVSSLHDPSAMIHFTYGDYPAFEGLKHQTCFRAFRSFTLAKFIGVDATMAGELIDGVNQLLTPEVEDWRAMGVFGPAFVARVDASAQDKLLSLFGINPK